jgi:hypothetical protein
MKVSSLGFFTTNELYAGQFIYVGDRFSRAIGNAQNTLVIVMAR